MKKVLMFIGGFVLVAVIAGVALFLFVFNTSDKLVCTSKEGDITLMYKGEELKGYTAKNITYDTDVAKNSIKLVGMEEYLRQFKIWFEANTSGTCE